MEKKTFWLHPWCAGWRWLKKALNKVVHEILWVWLDSRKWGGEVTRAGRWVWYRPFPDGWKMIGWRVVSGCILFVIWWRVRLRPSGVHHHPSAGDGGVGADLSYMTTNMVTASGSSERLKAWMKRGCCLSAGCNEASGAVHLNTGRPRGAWTTLKMSFASGPVGLVPAAGLRGGLLLEIRIYMPPICYKKYLFLSFLL